ncbi:MAG: S1 RNA-binding domain-containing protein [Planctomycetota bacterium]|jgi:small subunit ribosomal protein S1
MTDVPNSGGPEIDPLKDSMSAESPTPGDPPATPPTPATAAPTSQDRPAEEPAADDMSAIDREVESALAGMNPNDLAELAGGMPEQSNPSDVAQPDQLPRGSALTGTVCGISGDDIFLEFGAKSQAVIPATQFKDDDRPAMGQSIDVVVDRYDANSGLLLVNLKGAIVKADWDTMEVGTILNGRVTGLIKGGLEVNLSGIRGFMPASQADLSPMKDISVLLNEVLTVEVMEVNKRAKNLLVSRRKVMARERTEKREELLHELQVGQVRKGTVGNLTDFGAFVDLGGVDGLIHKRDLSYASVDNVGDIIKSGDEVEVQILKIDLERNRISLGLKQTMPDPWVGIETRYAEGTNLKARVIRLADFGAFAEIEPGVEALIPISEMGWSRVRRAADAVSVGDMVDCAVMRLEPKRRRIALSMKQAQVDPWEGVLESFEEKSLVKGKVTRLADFGVFVELAAGVEGMIHISELADNRVRSCADVVSEGDEVETRVLGVDKENRRISLSIRQVTGLDESAAAVITEEAPKSPKKRKKPLRGGLSSHFDW